MNVRKPVDYGTMHRELTAILAQNLPQMEEVYAIGKVINQCPEKGAAVRCVEETGPKWYGKSISDMRVAPVCET